MNPPFSRRRVWPRPDRLSEVYVLSTVVYLIVPAQSHRKGLLGALDYMDSKSNREFLPPSRPRLLSKSGIGHSFRYADEFTQLGSQNYRLGQTFCSGRHKLSHPACSGQDNLSSGSPLSLSTFFWHYYTTACFLLLSLSRQ